MRTSTPLTKELCCQVSWTSRKTRPEMVPVNGGYANDSPLREVFILHVVRSGCSIVVCRPSEMQGARSNPAGHGGLAI